jgi:hypothetical protein
MRRPFVAYGITPSASAKRSARPVTAVRNRAGTRNHNHTWAVLEGCLQRNLHVTHHVNGSNDNFFQNLADDPGRFRSPRA